MYQPTLCQLIDRTSHIFSPFIDGLLAFHRLRKVMRRKLQPILKAKLEKIHKETLEDHIRKDMHEVSVQEIMPCSNFYHNNFIIDI